MGPKRSDPFRHVDGASELVIDTSHLPLLITTWFSSPSLALAEVYADWFASYVERSRAGGRRFVILDDASRAGRPVPQVRGRLSKIACPPEVVIDRVVVVDTPAIRGAITALSSVPRCCKRSRKTSSEGGMIKMVTLSG